MQPPPPVTSPSPSPPERAAPVWPHLPPDPFRPGLEAPPPRRPWLVPLLFLATLLTLLVAGQDADAHGEAWYHWRRLLTGAPYALSVIAILGAHEMGHYLACRRYRIPATLPFFLPSIPPFGTFGAVIRIRGRIPDRRALFDVAVAGPIAGFVVAVPVYVWGFVTARGFDVDAMADLPPGTDILMFGESLLARALSTWLDPPVPTEMNSFMLAAWLGTLVTALNLFPVGQLDGGHMVYALSRRLHRTLARLTIAGLAGLIAWQALIVKTFPAYVLWFVILVWMRDRHPPLLDESTPVGRARAWVAVGMAVMFLVCFTAVPIRIVGF